MKTFRRDPKKHFSLNPFNPIEVGDSLRIKTPTTSSIILPAIFHTKSSSIAGSQSSKEGSPMTSPLLSATPKKSVFAFGSVSIKGNLHHPTKSLQGTPQLSRRSFEKKEKLQCFFCGGKGCKHENWLNNKNSVIKGLDSDWITDNILAMQRPSSRLLREYNIVDQFKNEGIHTVINVQEPGEHPYCGDGILPESGFSYLPEELSDRGIYFYTLGWRDLKATEFTHMLKIMDIMSFSLQNGNKVAVHCHAGRGRTLLVIASWLIFSGQMSADQAIQHCCSRREGGLSKEKQRKFLQEFEKYLIRVKRIFHDIPTHSLQQIIKSQKTYLNSEKAQETKYIPLILQELVQRLESMLNSGATNGRKLMKAFLNVEDIEFQSKWGTAHEEILKHIKHSLNKTDYKVLDDVTDPRILCQLILDFFENLAIPAFDFEILHKVTGAFDQVQDISSVDTDRIFSHLPRIEFYLLQKFSYVLALINKHDPSTARSNHHFGARIALSLLLLKKKYQNYFNGRVLQPAIIDNKHIACIANIIILFSQKSSTLLEAEYKGSVNIIMNKSRPDSETNSPSIGSPPKLSRFAASKGSLRSSEDLNSHPGSLEDDQL